uniref:DNA repair endonuclease XPF n=1 Tax=Plectus sambesii TaxID=2011161 RepID=A0A914XFT8_9BILA
TSKVEAPAVVELSGSSDEDDASEEPTTSAADTEGKEDEEVVVSRPPDPPLSVRPQGERYNLLRHLDCSKPTFVILYHVELATLRMLEMYKAANPDRPLRIYVFMYRESTEEERYLTALRREQDSFENLIREQGTLLIPREYDTARDAPSRFEAPVSTRRAGGRRSNEEQQAEDTRPQVIVDVREFNSELPSVVYKRGIDIVPVTLEVGDYVLAGDVCVERKALDDLVGSLQNGRVFKQAEQMLRHYSNSVLLVEASGRTNGSSKRRIGVGGGPFQGEMSKRCREIRSLLTVLVRYQPNLRIVWSTEPQATVELFEEIKFGKEEPNVEKAVAVRSDELGEEGSSLDDEDSGGTVSGRINPAARQMVTHIPTLASGDVDRVLRSASSLLWLCRADFNQLTDCCGGNHLQADALRTFFNTDFRAAGGW